MPLILASLFFTLLFGFLSVLIINVSIYLWETKRVNNLASSIHHTKDSILNKNNVDRKFSSHDWSLGLSKQFNKAANSYERTLVKIETQEYPGWFKFVTREFENLRKYTFRTLARFWKYILQLSKPYNHSSNDSNSDDINQKDHKEDINDFVDKVFREKQNAKNASPKSATVGQNPKQSQENLSDQATLSSEDMILDIAESQKAESDTGFENSEATIGLSARSNNKDNLFEKLEAKILKRLQAEGLNHYEIWLELGVLYEKYGESQKAKEVYALVMKQSEGKEKELARDRLIGI